MTKSIVISSGHGLKVRGARGYIDEVEEARKVVDQVTVYLKKLGCSVESFHDNVSTNQNQNLQTIVRFHNSRARELDVSVHFNSSGSLTDTPIGVEVLWYSEKALAEKVSKAIADASGLKNRGAKQRKELYFLRNTTKPAILIEVCFVNSKKDVELYRANFDKICRAIAETLAGKKLKDPTPITQPKEEVEMFKPTSPTIYNSVVEVLKELENKSVHGNKAISPTWRAKFEKGELSISDALGLIFVAKQRGIL